VDPQHCVLLLLHADKTDVTAFEHYSPEDYEELPGVPKDFSEAFLDRVEKYLARLHQQQVPAVLGRKGCELGSAVRTVGRTPTSADIQALPKYHVL